MTILCNGKRKCKGRYHKFVLVKMVWYGVVTTGTVHKSVITMFDVLGDRNAVIARELTKVNEEYIRGALSELKDIDELSLKGEMVVLIEGNTQEEGLSDSEISAKVEYFMKKGLSKKDSIQVVSELYSVNKNKIKELFNY